MARIFLQILALVALLCLPLAAGAQDRGLIDPSAAHKAVGQGKLTLIDVRTLAEWKKTGLPVGAHRATIRGRGDNRAFFDKIAEVTGGDKDKPIALICATGSRTAYSRKLLIRHGYKNVYDVAGGLFGSIRGPGWLKQSLPMQRLR